MSFNSLSTRANLTLHESLIASIQNVSAITVGERDSLESLALDIEAYKELLASKVIARNIFTQLNIEQEANEKALIDYKIKEILILEKRLLDLVKEYYNKIEVKKLGLISKSNELRKKVSLISKFNNKVKFAIREDFINLYNIDSTRNNKVSLDVDTVAEVATLPISKRSKIAVNKILISKETNGIPGNINTGKNKLIYNLIDENPDTCFEIYKKGSGPLKVKIILDLKKEEIINELIIGKMNITSALSFKIKDLVYTDANGKRYNIESLVDKKYQKLEVDSYTYNDSLAIKHLPVKAVRVTITLETLEYTLNNKEKVFSLGIKNLELYTNTYQESGELNSNVYQTPEGLYSLRGSKSIFPSNSGSYSESMKVSLDKGGEYQDITKTELVLDGKSKELIFNYNLKREDKFIEEIRDENIFVNVNKITRNINRNISPVNYALEEINEKTLKVVQPKILSRGEKAINIGFVGNKGKNIIPLPYNLNKSNIKRSEIMLQMNNEFWVNKESETLVDGNGSFYVRENGKEIVVNLTEGSYTAKLSLIPKRAEIIKKPEGYYCPIAEKFDYDKDEIKVTSLYGSSDRVTEFLPKAETRFFLKEENLDSKSFELYYLNNSIWIKESEDNYEVNTQDGIVYYSENLDKERKCIYKYFKENVLNKEDYEIWAKGNQINGLFFYEDKIYIEEVTQKLKETSTLRYDSINREYLERKDVSVSEQCFVLKHENIVQGSVELPENLFGEEVLYKEVEYIDGFTEFLNLNFMENDPVPNIEKDATGRVRFTLVEVPYLDKGLKVKVFKGEEEIGVASVDGRICTITLKEEDNTSKGYSVEYYYLGVSEEVLKFSVDYLNGVIYTEEAIAGASIKDITYSIADVYLEYDIYKEISNFKIANGIAVYTEEFLNINNRVKFLWFENSGNFNLEGLEQYYSPIIYNLNLEMA